MKKAVRGEGPQPTLEVAGQRTKKETARRALEEKLLTSVRKKTADTVESNGIVPRGGLDGGRKAIAREKTQTSKTKTCMVTSQSQRDGKDEPTQPIDEGRLRRTACKKS